MRFNKVVSTILLVSQGLPVAAWAQSAGTPELALCDPFIEMRNTDDDNGNEDDSLERVARYDQEVSEVLTSDEVIMDAIYEEKWDPATDAPVERQELCQGVSTYVINWAELVGPGEDGTPTVLAKGMFSLHKDGTFQFDYNKRPYTGQWSLADQQMSLTAGWLNGGEAFVSPVERVETPIELTYTDGREDSYTEEVYRIGPFRLLPMDTTVKGALLHCACPTE